MTGSAAPPQPQRQPLWRGPLVVGLCFAFGYGITQRLLALGLPQLVRLGQGFEVRPFPGTSLESLRLRFGAEGLPLRADLERQRLEEQQQQAERRAELARQRLERQLAGQGSPEEDGGSSSDAAASSPGQPSPAPERRNPPRAGSGLSEQPPQPPPLPPPQDSISP